MARRTVTATFQGGMISDEPKPGTALYIENMAVRPDGLIPLQPVRSYKIAATSVLNGDATASAAALDSNTVVGGWSAGGTVHPKIGLVALADTYRATATPTALSQWPTHLANYGAEGAVSSGDQWHRSLVNMRPPDIVSTTATAWGGFPGGGAYGASSLAYVDNATLCPIWPTSLTTTSTSMTGAFRTNGLAGPVQYINIDDEVLILNRYRGRSVLGPLYDPMGGITRYAGGRGRLKKEIGVGGNVTSVSAIIGIASAYTTGEYTDKVVIGLNSLPMRDILEDAAGDMYVGIQMGPGLSSASTTADQQTHEFRIIGTTSTGGQTLCQLDRKIYVGAANRFMRCVLSNTARLSSNQLSTTAATQPFDEPMPTAISNGWRPDREGAPYGRGGGCYHQGRLFLADGSKLMWSATEDETLQLTSTSLFSTAYDTTAAVTATANFGIEFKGISLWDPNGFLKVFPSSGDIVGIASLNDELVILKTRGIYRLVGGVSYDGSSNSLDLQVISSTLGPDTCHSWAETPNGIVFTHNSQIFMYDGNELVDISSGSISHSFLENVATHRIGATAQNERVPTRVVCDSEYVYFTPMRYALSTSTSTSIESAMTTSMYSGDSIHSRHLVLSLRDLKWSYVKHNSLSVPAAVLPMRTTRGNVFAKYWLGQWRVLPTATGLHNNLELTDIHNMFHEAGTVASIAIATGVWSESSAYPSASHVVTHPLADGFDAIRPRSSLLKHTLAIATTSTSTSTALNTSKVHIVDGAPGYTPALTTSFRQPEWWDDLDTRGAQDRDQEFSDSEWAPRAAWDVAGASSTARAISQVDRMMLENFNSIMTSPVIHYRDDYWWRDYDKTDIGGNLEYVYRYGSHILHGLALEIDEPENRTDR